ncbi:MAG: hypothetical protein K0S39_6304 [Paenibacillus sp.]|nr:hypothetical protein [Paenibacillus sp.]
MVWSWIAGIAVVLLVMMVLSNIKVSFTIKRDKSDDDIVLDVHGLFGLIKKRIAIPIIKFKNFTEGIGVKTEYVDKKENQLVHGADKDITKRLIKEAFENVRELLTHCFEFNEWLLDTLGHVRCTRIFWKTNVGVGDAPETALTTGMVWGLKSSLLGFVFRFIKLDARPEIIVMPHFNEVKFSTEVICYAQIRFFYVLQAGLHLIYRILNVKNGLKSWQKVFFKAGTGPLAE